MDAVLFDISVCYKGENSQFVNIISFPVEHNVADVSSNSRKKLALNIFDKVLAKSFQS